MSAIPPGLGDVKMTNRELNDNQDNGALVKLPSNKEDNLLRELPNGKDETQGLKCFAKCYCSRKKVKGKTGNMNITRTVQTISCFICLCQKAGVRHEFGRNPDFSRSRPGETFGYFMP